MAGPHTANQPRRIFDDRRQAGRVLAELLQQYRRAAPATALPTTASPTVASVTPPSVTPPVTHPVVILGLARGGIPVASEVARALNAPLEAIVVRKLGAPGHEEFALGAIASGGQIVFNTTVPEGTQISPQQLQDITARETRELERREAAYHDNRPRLELTGATVILVDDGMATGSSMLAAVRAVRACAPAAIVIAVPVAPDSTCSMFTDIVDDVVCACAPTPFWAVGESFADFTQVSDDDVRTLLASHKVSPQKIK